nr:uncharacterized protein LOC113474872 isoform X1 [Ciona intestinalis]|eukprot:XP_026693465.1 uncharacterized protein LOC113474872 isoform X1 [Ciona intestinalis]
MKSHIQENKSVRQNISKSFSEVACFPMEHPGKKVAKRKESDDSGVPLKDMDDDFLQQVDEVARYLFSPDRLVIKRLNGKIVTGEQFIDLAIEYSKILSSGKMPKVEAFHVASKKTEKIKQIKQIEVESIAAMETKVGGKYIDPKKLGQLHDERLAEALKKFDKDVEDIFDDDESKTYREKMEDVFRLAHLRLSEKNKKHKGSVKVEICKRAADAAQDYKVQLVKKLADNVNEEDMAIYEREFKRSRSSFVQWANQTFDVSVVGECMDAIQRIFMHKFEEFESEQLKHQEQMELKSKEIIEKAKEKYLEEMQQRTSDGYKEKEEITSAHELATEKAMEVVNNMSDGKAWVARSSRRRLSSVFDSEFKNIRVENQARKAETKNGVLQLRTSLAETYFTIMTETFYTTQNKETYLDEPKLEKIHLATKTSTLNAYDRRVRQSFKEYKQHLDALTEDIAGLFEKVKEINRSNKISEELDKFCKILATEYLNMICRVMSKRYVDWVMVTETHEMFTHAIELEIENVVENKNVRAQCIALSEKTLSAKFDEAKARSSLWNKDGSPAHSVGVFGKIGKKLGLFAGKSPTKLLYLVKDLKSIAHLKALGLGGE